MASYKWSGSDKYDQGELNVLTSEDDAATANWGESWAMPTHEQVRELIIGCKWKWTSNYKGTGFIGYIGTSRSNGNNIFFPVAGYYKNSEFFKNGTYGTYWTNVKKYSSTYLFYFLIDEYDTGIGDSYMGRSVRAVVRQQ